MSVIVNATAIRPEMFGDVVDMPAPDVYIIENTHGRFYVHDEEIREFFYN